MSSFPKSGRFSTEKTKQTNKQTKKKTGNPLSILAWETPWAKEPGKLQTMGWQKSQT